MLSVIVIMTGISVERVSQDEFLNLVFERRPLDAVFYQLCDTAKLPDIAACVYVSQWLKDAALHTMEKSKAYVPWLFAGNHRNRQYAPV